MPTTIEIHIDPDITLECQVSSTCASREAKRASNFARDVIKNGHMEPGYGAGGEDVYFPPHRITDVYVLEE